MPELDFVKKAAKEALIIMAPAGGSDSFLWERAERLVRNVEHIRRLAEISRAGLQTDRFCLITATYFSDTGLARCLDANNAGNKSANLNINNNGLLELSAQIADEKLRPGIDAAKTKTINRIIVESGNHFTNLTEAMILADARNLDDMGAAGVFYEMRRCTFDGKNISDILQLWKRKADYRYWHARLKDGFRFDAVRKLAERRLSAAESFINQLKLESTAEDLEEIAVNSASYKPITGNSESRKMNR